MGVDGVIFDDVSKEYCYIDRIGRCLQFGFDEWPRAAKQLFERARADWDGEHPEARITAVDLITCCGEAGEQIMAELLKLDHPDQALCTTNTLFWVLRAMRFAKAHPAGSLHVKTDHDPAPSYYPDVIRASGYTEWDPESYKR